MIVKEDLVKLFFEDFQTNYEDIWAFGNGVLYDMCKNNIKHDNDSVSCGKIWLIGRSYAAAIERIKKERDEFVDFYKNDVSKCFHEIGNELDDKISQLKGLKNLNFDNLQNVLNLHFWLMQEFEKITDLEKRSLVSKYLHFHLPNAFLIYDTRAISTITKMVKKTNGEKIDFVGDSVYVDFCVRAITLLEYIKDKYNVNLSLRDLDNFLLYIDEKYYLKDRVLRKQAKKEEQSIEV